MSENTSRKEQILKDTVDLLASHRLVVFGLCAAMQSEEACIETIMSHIKGRDMSTDNVDPGARKTYIDPGASKTLTDNGPHKTCVDPGASKTCVDPEARKTGFQAQSLQCLRNSIFHQNKTLEKSFYTLNKHFHDNILDTIRKIENTKFYFPQKIERSTQTVTSFKAIENGNILDISDIKQEKIEEVVVIRNQLWETLIKYEEQFKKEKEISAAYQTEVSQLKEQLKELQIKHEKDLRETDDHHALDVNKFNAIIKGLQNELQDQRIKCQNDMQESITKYESEATTMNETIHQLQRELEELEDQKKRSISDLHEKIACHELAVNNLTSENRHLKDQLQTMREESEKTLQGHETKISQLKEKNENLVQQVNVLNGKITELQNLLREEGEKNKKAMQEKAGKHDSEVSQLNETIAGLEEQLRVEEKERRQEHKKEKEVMKQSFEDEKRQLEEQLNSFHLQARKRPVQLSYIGKGDLMPKVLEELKMALVDKLGITRHELQFVTCLKGSDVDPDIPLLALCINVSRLGTDASTTMQNIQASKNVLLVILHHKDEHALPSQTSDRVLTGPEFHNLAGIYDIGFLAEKGIYSCNMNNKAIDGIVEFITKKEATMNSKPDK